MDGIFPGVGLFFGVLVIIFVANVGVVAMGIPFLSITLGIAFLGWIVWGIAVLVAGGMRR
jgi:hypothetical protein